MFTAFFLTVGRRENFHFRFDRYRIIYGFNIAIILLLVCTRHYCYYFLYMPSWMFSIHSFVRCYCCSEYFSLDFRCNSFGLFFFSFLYRFHEHMNDDAQTHCCHAFVHRIVLNVAHACAQTLAHIVYFSTFGFPINIFLSTEHCIFFSLSNAFLSVVVFASIQCCLAAFSSTLFALLFAQFSRLPF